MLKLSIIEFFLRSLPEAFIFVLGAHAFCKKNICVKPFFISTVLLSMVAYLIRMLPIHFGVHTIILLVGYVLVMASINELNIIKSASSGLILVIILFAAEWLNVYVLTNILKLDINVIFKDPLKKLLYGIPSLLLFFIIIVVIAYKNLYLERTTKNISSRKHI
ncbi:hypothetical protein [Clostridium aciditolerans]|uniref:Uncharacterized protein n=1 Tax=Clostridium aciditolerans TaxID=339861 RepID=A0A934M2C7_9CLOT|nr:hypothetical protein [Clostridium aciditolerans]MBI6874274.1 hypothetical protein [Clostridium aciditolerans]